MPDLDLRTGPHNGHLLVHALRRHRDAPVLHIDGDTWTGQDLADRTSCFIQALDEVGVGSGSTVGLLALNRPEVLVSIGAGQLLGLRRTALHPLGSVDDHAYVLADAGVETLIVDPLFADRARALLERVDCLTQVLTFGPSDLGTDISALTDKQTPEPLVPLDLPPDTVVGITYTGGTTGKPKGVVGTTGSIATMTTVQLAEWEWPEQPRFLMCTPLSHAGAAFFLPTLMAGGSMVVLPRFDPAEVLEAIERHRVSATMLVPSMLYALMDHPDSRTRDLSSLETIYYGASAINPTRLAEGVERFGPIFAQYYGQSEAPMVITYLAKADHLRRDKLASCGRPSAFLRTALLDETGERVPVGEPGEICVAGPLLAAGYWNLPDETAETFRDGWLHTGDVAREDEDGFWYIVDRTKDMIVTGGFNVFPREVEDVVAEHPAVAQVGVIGVPDEKWGEAVTAVVVLREGYDDGARERVTAEIQEAVKQRKGSVHTPKQVEYVDALPLTALGKPDKKTLRATYWQGHARSV
ncbi:AMP-binding protein [Nocardioides sp. HDW12B]|uniref:fatty-acid--CoA ligase FadD8 n=1 Tax=Nocardioides sp. HDW12B TaxID=2714939 RepID=UPI00140D1927|nr:fatty-acid--CoA ligase FadD8 [Nocardioides sp. HDW12B]QIK66305.1 AMP-binding protein [Nocardioides sp. HDW12B]